MTGLTVVLGAALAGCHSPPVPPPSLLVVTWDTVRADRAGDPAITPNLADLAAQGASFTQARTTAPVTLPAHASLWTGLQPTRHGARSNGWFQLDPAVPTLAQAAQGAGFRTGAFVSAAVLDARYGLGRGFATYDDRVETTPEGRHFAERPADRTVAAALAWLTDQPADAPVLLWVHLFDPHRPWLSPLKGFEGSPYDGEIAWTDRQTGHLLEGWRAAGRLEHSVVVVASDHGEGLGEHGEPTHGFFAYDSTMRIPLVIRVGDQVAQAVRGVRIDGPASLIDVAPTLATLAALPFDGVDGRSLVHSLATGTPVPSRSLPLECITGALEYGTAPVFAVVDPQGETWFDLPRREHYAADDADQVNDLYRPDQAETANALFAAHGRAWPPEPIRTAPDEEQRARLEALGYLEAAAPLSPTAPDPKDALDLLAMRQGGGHAWTPSAALDHLDNLAADRGTVPVIEELRVDLLDQLGRLEEADALLAARAPSDPRTAVELERRLGARAADRDLAARIRQARQERPQDPDAAYDLGVVLQRLGELEEAAKHLAAALALRPADDEARKALLQVRVAQNDLAAAAELVVPVVADPTAHGLLNCDAGRLLGHHLNRVADAGTLLQVCADRGGELLDVERGWVDAR